MSILCTHPGRHGDLLWALPTVRALSETYLERVDLWLPYKYGSLGSLLLKQPYIREVHIDPSWEVQETAPMTPRVPYVVTAGYDRVFHLGYEGWPSAALPFYTAGSVLAGQWKDADGPVPQIDLTRPWIRPTYHLSLSGRPVIGFTDEWFELKVGLYRLLFDRFQPVNLSTSPRWIDEAKLCGYDWEGAAAWLATARVFLGDCSALHVLAVATGVPKVLLVEPNPHRHHPVFYPLGTTGRVTLVRGNDGQPTFDARHTADALQAALREVPACA